MKNKILIVGAIIILIIIGFVIKGKSGNKNDSNGSDAVVKSESSEKLGSFRDLIAGTNPQECSFSRAVGEAGSSEGTVHTSNHMMRGDFSVTTSAGKQNMHMIIKDNKSYIWIDGQSQGFISTTDTTANPVAVAGQPQASQNKSVGIDDSVSYKCGNWNADASVFVEPSTVKFVDMSAMMKANASSQCATCDGLQEPSKSQCRQALSCK